MLKTLTFAIIALGSLIPSAGAVVLYDEAVSGDLSNNPLNPTALNASLGSNVVKGTTQPNPGVNPDFFAITIPVGQQLTAIILDTYNTTENQSFFAVQKGSILTGNTATTSSQLLGYALVGLDDGIRQGDNVLDDLGAANNVPNPSDQPQGFVGSLGAGTYTFWFQETVAPVEYAFDFEVEAVPEPFSLLGMGIAVGIGAIATKKRPSA